MSFRMVPRVGLKSVQDIESNYLISTSYKYKKDCVQCVYHLTIPIEFFTHFLFGSFIVLV